MVYTVGVILICGTRITAQNAGESFSFLLGHICKQDLINGYFKAMSGRRISRICIGMIKVICTACDIEKLEDIIFADTSTIGIRKYPVSRRILRRKNITVSTIFGDVNVKVTEFNSKERYTPEAESVKEICERTGKGWQEVYSVIMSSLHN